MKEIKYFIHDHDTRFRRGFRAPHDGRGFDVSYNLFLRARSRMCGRYLRSQLVQMTNIGVYNNSVGLQTLK
jgi:hypothetical protein